MTHEDYVLPGDLQHIFESGSKLQELKDFAARSFCEENVLFLEEVLEMKRTRSVSEIESILNRYIRPDSPCQVNIDHNIAQNAMLAFKQMKIGKQQQRQVNFGLFQEAFQHVAKIVQNDTLPKLRGISNSEQEKYTVNSVVPSYVLNSSTEFTTWFRGHLLRRKGFFGFWKPFTYMKKGNYLFEFKPGANHVKSVPLNTICLEGSLVETARTITGRDNSFILHSRDGKSLFFQASSKEEMEEWIDELTMSTSLKMRRSRSRESNYSLHNIHVNTSNNSTSSSKNSISDSPPLSPSPPAYNHMEGPPIPLTHAPSSAVSLTEEELAKAMPLLNFLDSFTDGIVVSDSAGIVIATNEAAEKMFGWKKDELKGRTLNVLMPEPYKSLHDGYMFRHEKFGDEKLIGKTRNMMAVKKDGVTFKIQISLGKLPIKGYFIATIRERIEEQED